MIKMEPMDARFLHEQLAQNLSQILGKRIMVLGCGAIGANLAISLARRGFKYFYLVDDDKIEEYNISTQPWTEQDLGKLKVSILGDYLYSTCQAEALTYSKRITYAKQLISWLPAAPHLIVDSFDNSKARRIAQELSASYPVLHAGMSIENTAEVTWAENYTIPQDIKLLDPCNYPLSRTLIELTVIASAESIIRFLLTGEKIYYLIDARKLRIHEV